MTHSTQTQQSQQYPVSSHAADWISELPRMTPVQCPSTTLWSSLSSSAHATTASTLMTLLQEMFSVLSSFLKAIMLQESTSNGKEADMFISLFLSSTVISEGQPLDASSSSLESCDDYNHNTEAGSDLKTFQCESTETDDEPTRSNHLHATIPGSSTLRAIQDFDELELAYRQLRRELEMTKKTDALNLLSTSACDSSPWAVVDCNAEPEDDADVYTSMPKRRRRTRRFGHLVGLPPTNSLLITKLRPPSSQSQSWSAPISALRTPELGLSATSTPASSPPFTPKFISPRPASMRLKFGKSTPSIFRCEQLGSPLRLASTMPLLPTSTYSQKAPPSPITLIYAYAPSPDPTKVSSTPSVKVTYASAKLREQLVFYSPSMSPTITD
ncbi:hypothetical protein BDN72DRAFT_846808 [Pluteus cervinus]|uniref:Uncharacterized protein n=1 Tax=Pluteus cervinus TaxID=181527 RepID=A0ACD3AEQ4_9AGAR|nr:hypothetical protein BDN72DRAFT_846808 [Pluteus cervinus]